MHRAANLLDPAIMGNETSMHALLRHLRKNDPVYHVEHPDFEPFWAITKHDDIKRISQNNDAFLNNPRTVLIQREFEQALLQQFGTRNGLDTLIHMDNPKHRKLRNVTREWFKPGPIAKLSEDIKVIARRFVDKMEACGGECDFVQDIAMLYPLRVIMSMIGIPPEEEAMMLKLTQEIFGGQDPTQSRGDSVEDGLGVLMDFFTYFSKVVEDRRQNPRNDMASILANALVDGAPMEQLDQISYFIITATAGHDTTSSSTSTAMWALATQPDLLQRLQADPTLIPAFIEEAVRWVTPVKTFMRSVAQDTELGGRQLKAGDWIMLCYASANRDETVFEDPFTFNIDRSPNKHLAFGFGPHVCLGQHLAKMEMRVLFEELLPKLKSVRLNGEAKLSESYFVNGLKTLPIQFKLA